MTFIKKFFILSLLTIFLTFCQSKIFAQSTLIHYWSFNSLTTAFHNPGIPSIQADNSVIDVTKANIVYTLVPGTSANYSGFWDNNAGDTTNARNGFPAGQALRFRNPSDSAELRMYFPTTGYSNIVIKYALESSSVASGQKTQLFDYSIDSGLTWKTSGLSITSLDVTQAKFQGSLWGLVTISLGNDTLVNNNPKVVFRIKFVSPIFNNSSGNNRFENMTVEGTFVPPVSLVPISLIDYWNFNTLLTAYQNPNIPKLDADFSTVDTSKTKLVYTLIPGTSSNYAGFIDNNPGDLTNARNGAPAGQALRFRNPSDSAELRLLIPTTNYKNIVVKYALQSSSASSGQKTQLFDFSTDGGFSWKTTGLSITSLDVTQSIFQGTNWGLVTINLNDTTVNNNFNLIFRIRFSGNTTGSSGNNRFDNITVEGTFVQPPAGFYTVTSPTTNNILTAGKHTILNFTISGTVGFIREIEYTTNHGLTWSLIGVTAGTSFDWVVPNIPSGTAFIRIRDEKFNWAATGPLTVFNPGPGVIQITKPVKGDTLIVGSNATINFTISGVVSETRNIDYSLDSGNTWKNIGSVSLGNSISWTVPNTPSAKALIRVTDTVNVIGMSNLFIIAPPPVTGKKTVVIDYWNFDNIISDTISTKTPTIPDMHPDYSSLDATKAKIRYYLLPGTSLTSTLRFIDPVAPGADTNMRSVVAPGVINNALRLRNPLDSMELRCSIPTNGYTDIKITYALESSSTKSGDSTNIFDYSIDGGLTWKNGKANGMLVNGSNVDTLDTTPLIYQGTSWGLVTVDLSADKTVENNSNFIFRVRFKGNTSLASGNNRFDNFTVEGDVPVGGQNSLVHYWNFDNIIPDTSTALHPKITDLNADYSALDKSKAKISYYLLPGTSFASLRFIDPVAPGADTNMRSVVAPGAINNALRLRNPLDSMELRCAIPTTGYTGIKIKYALESSSTKSGDSTNIFDYSIDGGLTWKNGKANGMLVNGSNVDTIDTTPLIFQGTSWGLVTIDLSADKSVENNPNLIFRVRFKGNTSLASGNNRFDNFTVEGIGSSGSGPAPSITVLAPVTRDTLVPGEHKTISFFVLGAVGAKRTIEFSSDSAKSWSTVGAVTEGTTYDWIVPNSLTGKGFIRVKDTANVLGMSGMFAIVQPGSVLTVTVGALPGIVKESDSISISWTASGYLGTTVTAEVSLDSQKTWMPIISSFAYKTKTSLGWKVPSAPHNGAIVRLTFASGASGISVPFDIVSGTADVAENNPISGNIEVFPNPFSQSATIRYELSDNMPVSIVIRDMLGREISQLTNGFETAGTHEVRFDGSHLPEGTYLYIMTAGGAVKQGKLVIMR